MYVWPLFDDVFLRQSHQISYPKYVNTNIHPQSTPLRWRQLRHLTTMSNRSEHPQESPTLPPRPSVRTRLATHLSHQLSPTSAHYVLLLCTSLSGASDAAAYATYSTFLSMQTGNTIFLALGASGQPVTRPHAWLHSLTSIVFFCIGCFLFFRVMRALGSEGRTRGALLGSFAVQAACLFLGAGLVTGGVMPKGGGDPMAWGWPEVGLIAILAFQAGGQMVASRVMQCTEVPTTVLTSVYCDLMGDVRLFGGGNAKRDKRATGVVCMIAGGVVGGWINKAAGLGPVLWACGGVKVILVAVWWWWRAERKGNDSV